MNEGRRRLRSMVAALSLGSLIVFLAATALGGVASGLGFGGGLSLANDLASPAERGAVTSSWFVAAYLGLAGTRCPQTGLLARRIAPGTSSSGRITSSASMVNPASRSHRATLAGGRR